MTKKPSEGEELLALHLRALGLEFVREYRFNLKRKWRFDFVVGAFPHCTVFKLAVEIEGGIWMKGRHNTGAGMEKDMDKYNSAAIHGWRVLRFSTAMVKSGVAIRTIEEALK